MTECSVMEKRKLFANVIIFIYAHAQSQLYEDYKEVLPKTLVQLIMKMKFCNTRYWLS